MNAPITETPYPTFSDQVAANIKQLRTSRQLSLGDLARRCAKLGAPDLSASVLRGMESGRPGPDGKRRRKISVDELVILGRALNAPPILLLFALGQTECSNVTPGECKETWAAIQWFIGHRPYSDQPGQQEFMAYSQANAPLALYELYEAHATEWKKAQQAQRIAEQRSTVPGDEKRAARIFTEAIEAARQALADMRDVRQQMMRHGFPLPDLPPGIDETDIDLADTVIVLQPEDDK